MKILCKYCRKELDHTHQNILPGTSESGVLIEPCINCKAEDHMYLIDVVSETLTELREVLKDIENERYTTKYLKTTVKDLEKVYDAQKES